MTEQHTFPQHNSQPAEQTLLSVSESEDTLSDIENKRKMISASNRDISSIMLAGVLESIHGSFAANGPIKERIVQLTSYIDELTAEIDILEAKDQSLKKDITKKENELARAARQIAAVQNRRIAILRELDTFGEANDQVTNDRIVALNKEYNRALPKDESEAVKAQIQIEKSLHTLGSQRAINHSQLAEHKDSLASYELDVADMQKGMATVEPALGRFAIAASELISAQSHVMQNLPKLTKPNLLYKQTVPEFEFDPEIHDWQAVIEDDTTHINDAHVAEGYEALYESGQDPAAIASSAERIRLSIVPRDKQGPLTINDVHDQLSHHRVQAETAARRPRKPFLNPVKRRAN